MKKIMLFGIVVIVLLMCTSMVTAAPALHRVTGGGTCDWAGGTCKLMLSVSAQQIDNQNNAIGRITEVQRSADGGPIFVAYQAEVLCLVVDGNKVWIAGEIVSSADLGDPSSLSVGDGILIMVEDGSPDKIFSAGSDSPGQVIEWAKAKFPLMAHLDLQGNMNVR